MLGLEAVPRTAIWINRSKKLESQRLGWTHRHGFWIARCHMLQNVVFSMGFDERRQTHHFGALIGCNLTENLTGAILNASVSLQELALFICFFIYFPFVILKSARTCFKPTVVYLSILNCFQTYRPSCPEPCPACRPS